MAREPREPQSYGSGKEWVEGRTEQQVNDPKSRPAPEHRDFYDEARDSETSAADQGGRTSPVQIQESDVPQRGAKHRTEQPIAKVTGRDEGAKRDSFFKRRDYE